MSQVSDQNQFSALSSPIDDGKQQEGLRSRFGKDDIKEQAYQAREQVKSRVLDPVLNLKEQVLSSASGLSTAGLVDSVTAQLQPAIDLVKQKAGLGGVSNEEAVAQATDAATGQWEEVKRKGNKQAKKVKDQVDAQLDANLTPAQKAKLQKGMLKAKAKGAELQSQARGLSSQLINLTLSNPRLRPVKSFIYRNNLQLPAVILGSLLSLWLGLTVIRLVTDVATPKVPEFDIHSKTATLAWLKYHAGDFKDTVVDKQESLAARAASVLSNYEIDKLKGKAIAKAGKLAGKAVDWREIGLNTLGLQEPTWGEWAWAKLTGRPITWQDRVESVLSLAKAGISRADLKTHTGLFDRVKDYIHPHHEPTMAEKAAGVYDSIRANIPGMKAAEPVGTFDSIKNSIVDGIDTIRSKLPGGESVEAARQRAYEATHQSTLGKVQSGLNYAANRIVHGSQEAAHVTQDSANKAADKAKWKMGL